MGKGDPVVVVGGTPECAALPPPALQATSPMKGEETLNHPQLSEAPARRATGVTTGLGRSAGPGLSAGLP
jgi:hypothetical protein